MSEILRVADSLRKSSDETLKRLLAERMINPSSLNDFFDLAEALTKPNSVAQVVAALPRRQVEALQTISTGGQPDAEAAQELLDHVLIDCISKEPRQYQLFTFTQNALAEIPANSAEPLALAAPTASQKDIDRDAAVAIFETLQAFTELIFDVEQRFIREVGKKSVGLPDLKRLATHLRKPNEYARAIYEFANFAGLINLQNSRWNLGSLADSWLTWRPSQRFKHLASTWRAAMGDASATELLAALTPESAGKSLASSLRYAYPLADSTVSSKIQKLTDFAELLGITAGSQLSSWAKAVLKADFDQATEAVDDLLPQPQARLICQADLSLIAPGPLPTDLEILLRRFSDTEQIGIASTYRVSALSLSHGLETGLTEGEIRELLVSLSGKALPQPLDYVIREAVARFGRLTVSEYPANAAGYLSRISSADPILLTSILNELKLKPFAIREADDGTLASRFEAEVLYFGLREIGIAAVRVDATGAVISPRAVSMTADVESKANHVEGHIKKMREADLRLGDSPDGDDVTRQITLAIKNKAKIEITIATADGTEIEYTLEPIGIANGRLRAKDRKADIERTLPLANITKVRL